jgi:hypothetical protein
MAEQKSDTPTPPATPVSTHPPVGGVAETPQQREERERRAAEAKQKADQQNKETLEQSQRSTAERVEKASEHEQPTPTQEENDRAKLAVSGGQQNPNFGQPLPADVQKRQSEANKPSSGGYQTKSSGPSR